MTQHAGWRLAIAFAGDEDEQRWWRFSAAAAAAVFILGGNAFCLIGAVASAFLGFLPVEPPEPQQ